MAHQPILRPDSLPHRRPEEELSLTDPEQDERDSGLFLAQLASTLASHGGGDSSADLALDLVLNEIVEQARLATTATGAAIALARGEAMVCRATTGANAPDLGVRLNTRSGLSGACVQTREVQRCDDTETDPRVDAAACRRLEVRSILIIPVLNDDDLLGVFEIFSPRPNAFGDRDIQTVQALCRRIVDNTRHAAETAAAPAQPPPVVVSAAAPQTEIPAPRFGIQEELAGAEVRPRDHWTEILTAVVVVLALVLGWMVGRAGWQSAMSARRTQSVAPVMPNASPPTAGSAQGAALATEPAGEKKIPEPAVLAKPKIVIPPKNAANPSPSNGLVVYENGKVIFHAASSQKPHQPEAGRGADGPEQTGAAEGSETSAATTPVPVSPEIASAQLIRRVEPQYPEEARQQHIEGPVVLQALVGKDGAVRQLRVVSGDTGLAAAAVDAVRQWRFKPYSQNGLPVEFETRVTVNFTLP